MLLSIRRVISAAIVLFAATSGIAQPNEATRYPLTGIPILDCAPAAPAPQASCLIRVPPGYGRGELQSDALGAVEGEFSLVAPGRESFPEDVTFSATILLVDLSPGPNAGRRNSFESEKNLMQQLIGQLPTEEIVAIYGFNEDLRLFQDFTADASLLNDTIGRLELTGSNTRIGTFVGDSISVLADRDDVLLRNLIIVSDGQEEGSTNIEDVVGRAVSEGVIISALGTFWRPFGAPENGAGMDYLRALTDGTSGITAQAQLDRPEDAQTQVTNFGATLNRATAASALILPDGEPQPSTITMELNEPVIGAPGTTRETEVTVVFRPVQGDEVVPEDETVATSNTPSEPTEPMLFGFPQNTVYIGAASVAAVLLALLLMFAFLRRGRSPEPDFADVEPAPAPAIEEPTQMAPAKPVKTASAYLVFPDGKARAGISGDKVSVGRAASNDIVIEAESLSRLHAQIYRNREGGYSVADMDSLNGTFVNDVPVKGTQRIQLGDTITFGKIKVKLVSA